MLEFPLTANAAAIQPADAKLDGSGTVGKGLAAMRSLRRITVWLSVALLASRRSPRGQTRPPTSLAAQEEAAIRAAVARVADSVVQIRTIGGLEEVDRTLLPDGPTTGLVISADGYIVSSAFNFVQQPASILVTFATGEQAPAELVAKDHSRMLVLLKAQGVSDLPVPEFVPVDEIRVGQWAIAVGRTFRADRPNISVGIVSALDRMFGKVIQTDADVSTANYGGPLVDIRGRVLRRRRADGAASDERSRRRRMVRLGHRLCRAARVDRRRRSSG